MSSRLTRMFQFLGRGQKMARAGIAVALPLAAVLAVGVMVTGFGRPSVLAAAPGAQAFDPCAFPTTPASSPEETAWRIFVAATCPSTGTMPLAFENWTEQTCLEHPSQCSGEPAATKRHLHASRLAQAAAGPGDLPTDECLSMTGAGIPAPPSLKPFVPRNLAENAKFCEEVFANSTEVAYIKEPRPGHSLDTLKQQASYVASGHEINFPPSAIEIKVDWLPAEALSGSPSAINCNDPKLPVYTEVINGSCYALVGIHISSKLVPKWLWATFEPQYEATNPNRCNPKLYNSCSDPWGSNPPTSTGENTAQTARLAGLMNSANLAPAFRNYRLVGVQTDFINSKTTRLGNSFVEFNAQVPAQQSSCITCHFYAQLNVSQSPPVQHTGISKSGVPATGTPAPLVPDWHKQDFSWLLGSQPTTLSSNHSDR